MSGRIGNVLNKVRKPGHEDAKRHLHNIMNAPYPTAARTAARRFADRRRHTYPKAVECLRKDLPTRFRYPTSDGRRQVRTANAIERRFRGSGEGPGPWAPSGTAPPWNASPSPSSHTKTKTTEPPPLSP